LIHLRHVRRTILVEDQLSPFFSCFCLIMYSNTPLQSPHNFELNSNNIVDWCSNDRQILVTPSCFAVRPFLLTSLLIIIYFPTSNKMSIIGIQTFWFIYVTFVEQYWSRTNYRHYFLVFFWLFLCIPIHPFKCLIILNVTNQLTLDENINNSKCLKISRGGMLGC
jgi:hypothetical protein